MVMLFAFGHHAGAVALVAIAVGFACGPSVALTSASGTASGEEGSTSAGGSVSASGTDSVGPMTTVADTSTTAVSTTGPSCAAWGESCEAMPCCDDELECTGSSELCLQPDDGSAFFLDGHFDGNVPDFECDLFAQDCPVGEKCMPWANDGGDVWNASRCSPVAGDATQPGEACTVEGSGVSGIDDCDLGVMCWNVDPATNIGTCVPLCSGDERNPQCEDASTTCAIANNGAIVLCLPTCHPLMQDCLGPNEACYPVGDDFVCAPNAAGDLGAHGDPCEYINVCNPGTLCLSADAHSACDTSPGCCSSVCSLADPDPDATCVALDAAQTCLPWYAAGQAPSGYEDVGVCTVTDDATIMTNLTALP